MANLRPPIQFSLTPPMVRMAPRPAGYDPDASWEEKKELVHEGPGHVYRVVGKAPEGKL